MNISNEIAPRISVAIQVSAARFVEKSRDERGDVPGWVLVTVMTAGLVVAVWICFSRSTNSCNIHCYRTNCHASC
jgi:hypothetical protein